MYKQGHSNDIKCVLHLHINVVLFTNYQNWSWRLIKKPKTVRHERGQRGEKTASEPWGAQSSPQQFPGKGLQDPARLPRLGYEDDGSPSSTGMGDQTEGASVWSKLGREDAPHPRQLREGFVKGRDRKRSSGFQPSPGRTRHPRATGQMVTTPLLAGRSSLLNPADGIMLTGTFTGWRLNS